jgi:hypothetical protein
MGDADLKIVAIAIILFVTYGTFLYLNASANVAPSITVSGINGTDYTTPTTGSFWDTITEVGSMQDNHPEIFFINTILFGTIAFLLLFVGLRFLRGTG